MFLGLALLSADIAPVCGVDRVGSLRSAIGLLAADVETQGGQGGGPGGARAIGARSAWRAQYEPTKLERTGNSGSSATRTSALSHHLQGIA